ncbi:hypothetical protein HOLleu_31072 [Holothuria leucospilota]|uniref:Uncharacterized protein n=1 Tax=Holothuria leucospilota TaxID=206669 RepID=A0A9Q1BLL4_HOLLE|nr:hypothetical protein HOLleu_31072 [Holothuria leucospilota]
MQQHQPMVIPRVLGRSAHWVPAFRDAKKKRNNTEPKTFYREYAELKLRDFDPAEGRRMRTRFVPPPIWQEIALSMKITLSALSVFKFRCQFYHFNPFYSPT